MKKHPGIEKMKRREFLTLSLATGAAASLGLRAPAGAQKVRTLRFGSPQPADSLYSKAMVMFADEVAKLSANKMKVETYPGSQLGGVKEMMTSVQTGSLAMTIAVPAWYSNFIKPMDVFTLPYLVHSETRLRQALEGSMGEQVSKLAEKANFKLLGWWLMGARHIVNNVRPVRKPADVAGLKVRVINSQVYMEAFRALGANTVVVDPAELYLALQQRVVDGFEYPLPDLIDAKLFEVSKYLSLDAHVTDFFVVSMNMKIWQDLAAEEQGVVKQAMKTSMDWQWSAQPAAIAKALQRLRGSLQVNDITSAERLEFIKATRPIYQKFEAGIGKDLLDRAIRELGPG